MPTTIEWCDETFNPWWGCEKVSPGCAHCYADTLANRFGHGLWGAEHSFRFFGDKHWAEPLKWARSLPAKLGRRPRVFCASMADVFEERRELDEHRRRLFELIELTPELDWLLLTKRPEFARNWLVDDLVYRSNVWMGVSIENARFTWRADVLREIPAAVRFISAEPLLGSLFEETRVLSSAPARNSGSQHGAAEWGATGARRRAPLDLSDIDWVIVGGESGPGARPFHLEHAREIVRAAVDLEPTCICYPGMCPRDCEPACPRCSSGARLRPAVFVKQLGARPIGDRLALGGTTVDEPLYLRDRKGGDMAEWPADIRIREFPRSAA